MIESLEYVRLRVELFGFQIVARFELLVPEIPQ